MISIENISKSYGTTKVLTDINLKIPKASQFAIEGASGSGKSTLLYLLGGLDRVDSGKINIFNKDIVGLGDEALADFRNRTVGFVFQFHFLLPSMNCMDNILLPAKIANVGLKDIKKKVLELVGYLKVENCLKKFPFEVSGGEQQRINIIRALSLNPALLLCDEPTGNLDSHNSELVIKLLRDLSSEFDSTLIIVTHDLDIAGQFESKITIEDGRIIG